MSDRLFDLDEVPEVPLFREPRRGRGAQIMDGRLDNDYPEEWGCCTLCAGVGYFLIDALPGTGAAFARGDTCPKCLGMGSAKAMARLLAGHRCERCGHPYVPRGDAKMLGVEPSGMHDCATCGGDGLTDPITSCPDCKGAGRVWTKWSACDERCTHGGPITLRAGEQIVTVTRGPIPSSVGGYAAEEWSEVYAEWRILTVHHLDGDKSNLKWWNLAALDQRCHLEIQSKVVMERVYPHEHSTWFKPHAAGYYAWTYLREDLTREEVMENLDELLALERQI